MPVWLVLVAIGLAVAVVGLGSAGSALLWVGGGVLLLGVLSIARGTGTRV